MPKASAARGWRASWWSTEITIADDDRAEILESVGVPPADARAPEVIARVSSVLGDYPGLVHVLDHAPRPANQIAALDEIIRHAGPFLKSLHDLDPKTSQGMPADVGRQQLWRDVVRFSQAARGLRSRLKLAGQESRGGTRRRYCQMLWIGQRRDQAASSRSSSLLRSCRTPSMNVTPARTSGSRCAPLRRRHRSRLPEHR